MIRHQAVSQNAHGNDIQAFFHDRKEIVIMSGLPEKAGTKVRPVQDVVNHPANIHSPRSAPWKKKVPDTFLTSYSWKKKVPDTFLTSTFLTSNISLDSAK